MVGEANESDYFVPRLHHLLMDTELAGLRVASMRNNEVANQYVTNMNAAREWAGNEPFSPEASPDYSVLLPPQMERAPSPFVSPPPFLLERRNVPRTPIPSIAEVPREILNSPSLPERARHEIREAQAFGSPLETPQAQRLYNRATQEGTFLSPSRPATTRVDGGKDWDTINAIGVKNVGPFPRDMIHPSLTMFKTPTVTREFDLARDAQEKIDASENKSQAALEALGPFFGFSFANRLNAFANAGFQALEESHKKSEYEKHNPKINSQAGERSAAVRVSARRRKRRG